MSRVVPERIFVNILAGVLIVTSEYFFSNEHDKETRATILAQTLSDEYLYQQLDTDSENVFNFVVSLSGAHSTYEATLAVESEEHEASSKLARSSEIYRLSNLL